MKHVQKAKVLLDIIHSEAQQKAVVQRQEFVVLGKLIAGPEERQERHRCCRFAIMKDPLVDNAENRIQDRGTGFEDFVQKGNMRLGQFVVRDPAIVVGFERFEADRAKEFFRCRELCQQPLEIACPGNTAT